MGKMIGTLVCLLVMCWSGLYAYHGVKYQFAKLKADGDPYHNSVGCGNINATDSRTPCTQQPMWIVRKWQDHPWRGKNDNSTHYDYNLLVEDQQRQLHTFREVSGEFYLMVNSWQPVTATVWRGHVVSLNTGSDHASVLEEGNDSIRHNFAPIIEAASVFGLSLAILLAIWIRPSLWWFID